MGVMVELDEAATCAYETSNNCDFHLRRRESLPIRDSSSPGARGRAGEPEAELKVEACGM